MQFDHGEGVLSPVIQKISLDLSKSEERCSMLSPLLYHKNSSTSIFQLLWSQKTPGTLLNSFTYFSLSEISSPSPFNFSGACRVGIAECGIRNVKTPETHFIEPNPTELLQSMGGEGQKTQKPIPFENRLYISSPQTP